MCCAVLLFFLYFDLVREKNVYLCSDILLVCIMSYRFYAIVFALMMASSGLKAQQAGQLEVFCGAELNYRDINFLRLYDVLLRATPGVKYHLGNDWMVAAQAYLPIWNEGYGMRGNMFRLNMADVSKEVHFANARQYFKFSAGLFGSERYGADVRWGFPVNSWLLFHARLGYTSHWSMGFHFEGYTESEFADDDWTLSGIGGASVWLSPWNTEIRASGGRYLNNDLGVEGEVIRHFNHCSVSAFAQRHESYKSTGGTNNYSFGFRVVMMLPPYVKPSDKSVVFRPASNFRLTYNAQSNGFSMKQYNTDPEENERTYPVRIPWGTGYFNE